METQLGSPGTLGPSSPGSCPLQSRPAGTTLSSLSGFLRAELAHSNPAMDWSGPCRCLQAILEGVHSDGGGGGNNYPPGVTLSSLGTPKCSVGSLCPRTYQSAKKERLCVRGRPGWSQLHLGSLPQSIWGPPIPCVAQTVKNLSAMQKAWVRSLGGEDPLEDLGNLLGGGNGNLLQYSCLETLVDRGAWWATVHRVAKSLSRLSN